VAGERILIIEDDPEYVEFLLTEVLSPLGFPAQAATNGAAGLSAAQEERPALVLLDLGLTDVAYPAMLQQLQNSGDPPVILLTSPGAEAKALHAIRLGARDAVMQPLDAQEISRAITRVLHQERVARERDQLVRKLAAANEALEQSLAELQTLYDLCKTISSSLDLGHVLTAVVHAAISMTHAEEGYLLLKDPESGKLYLRALQNLGAKQASTLCVLTADSIARHVVHTGEPVALFSREGISIKVGSKQSLYDTGRLVRSLVNVPLQKQQRVIGVLAVDNAVSDRSFSQSDVMLLSALADAATIAIENAQLYACADQKLHHALEELAAVQHKTGLVLEHISEGVVTVNKDLYITSVNAAIARITGWQASELLGRRYEEVLSPLVEETPGPEQTLPRRALDSQTAVGPTSATIRHKDGGHIPVILTATSIRASDASVTGALVTVRDLTRETNWDNRRQEMLDMLQSQGLQLDQLTEETLDTLHMEAGTALPHCHPVTLKPIVTQIIKNYQETGSGGPVRVALAPDLPFAMGNESQIELALLNLVENVRGPNAEEQPVVISADVQDDRIVISVEGPGSAIPPEQHEHSLYSLHSSDNSGASSGDQPPWWILPQIRLYIARKLIQAQGGQFWTENQSGTNIRFHFSLPKIEVTDDAQALID
jgi:two-component system NtrC family sensor kinase